LPPSGEMRAYWRAAMAKFELNEHHLRLLEAACQAWDRMMQAPATLAEHGFDLYRRQRGVRIPFPQRQSCKDQPIAFRRACQMNLSADGNCDIETRACGVYPVG